MRPMASRTVKRNPSVNATTPLSLRPSSPRPPIVQKTKTASTTKPTLARMNVQIQSVVEESAFRVGSGNERPDCSSHAPLLPASRSPARFGPKTPIDGMAPPATPASLLVSTVIALSPRSPQRSDVTTGESGALRPAAAGGEIGKNRSEVWNAESDRNARSGQPRLEARRREIEKGAQLDRQEAAGGVDEADRPRRRLELVEHGRQGSRPDHGPDM